MQIKVETCKYSYQKTQVTINFKMVPGLRILVPDRALWIGEILQGQKSITVFTNASKFGGGTGAGVFCSVLGLEFHFRKKDDRSMFQAEFFEILKAIELKAGRPISDSE